jgi:hypothetical protein
VLTIIPATQEIALELPAYSVEVRDNFNGL